MTNFMTWKADSAAAGSMTLPGLGSGVNTGGSLVDAIIDTSEKHEGTASMRVEVLTTQGDDGYDGVVPQRNYGHNFTGSQNIYYRWWMKIQDGFDWGSAAQKTKAARFKQEGDTPPIYGTFNLHKTGITIQCTGTGGN